MTSYSFLLAALISMFLFLGARAAPQDGQDNALKPYFNVQSGTSAARGGCDEHDSVLRVSWEEACKMSRKALDDALFIGQNLNNGQKGPDPQQDPAGSKRWNRIYPMLLVMFGDPFDDQGTLFTGDREVLIQVQKFYLKMRGACSTRASAGGGADTLLLCDDKFVKWIPNGQPDPEHPEAKIEDNHPDCARFGGLWYSDQLPEPLRYRPANPPQNRDSQYICDAQTYAWTDLVDPLVSWCQTGLADVPSIDAIRANIKGPKPLSQRMAPGMIKVGLLTELDHIAGDTSKNDMPTTWVHEMGHAFFRWVDEQSYDGKGVLKTEQKPKWNPDTGTYINSDEPLLAYTFKYASRLAQHAPERAIKNPENFALFAKAMYLSEWDWHRGYAQPPP